MQSLRLSTCFICLLSALALCCQGNGYSRNSASQFLYPDARRDMCVVDDFNGTEVHDPYRWLEDPDSVETKAFIRAQNVLSRSFFDSCAVMDNITEKLTQKKNYSSYKCPMHVGGRYYYFHNTGLQNQDVLYVQQTLDSEPSVVLNPNDLSQTGTTSLDDDTQAFSKDGTFYAYGVSEGGSDWLTIKVKNVLDEQDLQDTVTSVRYSFVAWTSDNQGFFYSAVHDQDSLGKPFNHSLYYHLVGTEQSQDVLVFHFAEDPNLVVRGLMSNDYNYVILYPSDNGITNGIYVTDPQSLIQTGALNVTRLIDNFDNTYEYVTNVGQEFIFLTDKDAPFKKLIKININNPEYDNWVTLVHEDPQKGVLHEARHVHDKLVLHYLNAAKSELYVHNLQTGDMEHKVELEMGSVECMEGGITDTELFFDLKSFLKPGTVFYLNMTTYNKTVFREITVNGFEPGNFETRQVFYTSYDGTEVPMFVVHKKDLQLSGNHPVMLYGYGGFTLSQRPKFRFDVIVFLQHMGGVFALANIRGGSEFGEGWHRNGSLENKQNVFDDFQAAAEFLINNNYTNTKKLAIRGRSNGGLLVAACLNQRPDLFAAVIAQVGVLDMLRFHNFGGGKYWIPEYGNPDNPAHFQWIYRYSPLHNILRHPAGGQYPATLVMTAERDDRVVPLHSLKFTAELQHTVGNNTNQINPLLLRVDTNAGHGAGTSTSKKIAEMADMYSFLCNTLHLQWSDM